MNADLTQTENEALQMALTPEQRRLLAEDEPEDGGAITPPDCEFLEAATDGSGDDEEGEGDEDEDEYLTPEQLALLS